MPTEKTPNDARSKPTGAASGGDNEGAKKVEKQLEAETGKDFEVTGTKPPTLAETSRAAAPTRDALHGEPELAYIVNDDGDMQVLASRPGYAPLPVPTGYRAATDKEIAAYIGNKPK